MRLFAATIFISAFLLFQVQPLIGKYILPWFGGSPGVWTTCLLFFQSVLLGGYAYAHFLTTRFRPKYQAIIHLVVLLLSLACLPIMPDASWKPTPESEPVTRILLLLSASIGLPYFVLSSTGPLLQRWFSLAHPGVAPYRLYSLSNAGSLLALLSYPFVFEPLLTRSAQGLTWSAGLLIFVGAGAACAWRIRRIEPPVLASDSPTPENSGIPLTVQPPKAVDRFMWIALPAVASILLLATTNKLCLDVAVVPFLWVLPLSVYLLSFIFCFDHPRWYSRRFFSALFAAGCGLLSYFLSQRSLHLPVQVAGYSLTLFAACMLCHGELYRLRPSTQDLTRYFLSIAGGGAIGSLLVAAVAPLVLSDYYELQIGLTLLIYLVGVLSLIYRSRALANGTAAGVLAALILVPAVRATGLGFEAWLFSFGHQSHLFYAEYWKEILSGFVLLVVCLRQGWRIGTGEWRRGMSAFPLMMTLLLGSIFTAQIIGDRGTLLESVRNFYGALKLRQYNQFDPASHYYLLSHGETTHGSQFLHAPRNTMPTTYYGATSGVGRAIDALSGPRHIGFIGLGSGTLAAYGRPGDTFRFYDINPDVVILATSRFSYLKNSAADVKVVMGDARLTLEAELQKGEVQSFDLLVLDAFSSDAIPVHLLTREAMGLYLKHLRPGGVIAVHVSNRYLNLKPVVEGLARYYGLHSAAVADEPAVEKWWLYSTDWILLTKDEAFLESREIGESTEAHDPAARVVEWTDDYASLLKILK